MIEGKIYAPGMNTNRWVDLVFHHMHDPESQKEADMMEIEKDLPYKELFYALLDGKIDSFDWKSERFSLWYICHRSTRENIKVQLSIIYMKDGNLIPSSHRNINHWKELKRELPDDRKEIRWRSLKA